MADETTETTAEATTTEATTTEATTTQTTETPQSFIDGEGNFKEGWEGAYLTEDQRANGRVAGGRVKSVQGLLATVINSDKMISGDKILRPSDSFGDEDWDAFYTAGGWTGAPIEITAPDGLPEGLWSDDRATKFSKGFDVLRLNPKQVAGIMELHNADIAEQITNSNNSSKTAIAELETALLAEKGNSYTQFKHNAVCAIEKGCKEESAEFRDRVFAKYNKDPDLVRLFGNLGGGLAETGGIPKIDMAPTPTDLKSQLNEAMNHPAFTEATHPEHTSIMSKVRELNVQIAQNSKVKQPA